MGRPRKPTNLKILEGDRKDRINREEPPSPQGLGDPPEWFDDEARGAWSRLSGLLAPMRVATRADSEAATIYCQAYSTWREASAIVVREGMLVESVTEVETKNGSTCRSTVKANPLLPHIRESQRLMMQALAQFGMTPSSRAGLHVREEPADDPLIAFLAGKGKGTDGKRRR